MDTKATSSAVMWYSLSYIPFGSHKVYRTCDFRSQTYMQKKKTYSYFLWGLWKIISCTKWFTFWFLLQLQNIFVISFCQRGLSPHFGALTTSWKTLYYILWVLFWMLIVSFLCRGPIWYLPPGVCWGDKGARPGPTCPAGEQIKVLWKSTHCCPQWEK